MSERARCTGESRNLKLYQTISEMPQTSLIKPLISYFSFLGKLKPAEYNLIFVMYFSSYFLRAKRNIGKQTKFSPPPAELKENKYQTKCYLKINKNIKISWQLCWLFKWHQTWGLSQCIVQLNMEMVIFSQYPVPHGKALIQIIMRAIDSIIWNIYLRWIRKSNLPSFVFISSDILYSLIASLLNSLLVCSHIMLHHAQV